MILLKDLVLEKDKDFLDYLNFLFIIDPSKWPSAKEALDHPFL